MLLPNYLRKSDFSRKSQSYRCNLGPKDYLIMSMQGGAQFLQNVGNRLANMSDSEIVAGLVAVALLSAYLLVYHRRRVVHRRQVVAPSVWPGKTIDVSTLKPRLAAVRLNDFAQPPRRRSFHLSLLALARRTVEQLAYFQAKRSEGHPQGHRP